MTDEIMRHNASHINIIMGVFMKLQILIPQYKETDEIVKPLLDSIALQQCVDFNEIGVIICNDGTDVYLSDELLKSYPFVVEYYKEPHRGVSATRNACLDHAVAEYVMFCDADDMFYNMCGLWIIFNEIYKEFDSLVSCFTEETRHPLLKEPMYINHDMDSTFVHGKVHRRQYLLDKDIRFNDKLTIHEDSYFNILCQSLSQNVKYCSTPFYLWKWRDESVCRHDPKYLLKTFTNMLDSNDAVIEALAYKGAPEKAIFYVIFMIFESYYMMNKPEWINQENKEYRDATEKRFAEYYEKWKDTWVKVPVQEKMQISQGVRGRQVTEGMQMESMTIDQWLNHIEELYANDKSND